MESLREVNNKVKWSMHGIGGDVFYEIILQVKVKNTLLTILNVLNYTIGLCFFS